MHVCAGGGRAVSRKAAERVGGLTGMPPLERFFFLWCTVWVQGPAITDAKPSLWSLNLFLRYGLFILGHRGVHVTVFGWCLLLHFATIAPPGLSMLYAGTVVSEALPLTTHASRELCASSTHLWSSNLNQLSIQPRTTLS